MILVRIEEEKVPPIEVQNAEQAAALAQLPTEDSNDTARPIKK